jgi:DNA repair exonuclease SbcCD ATPase subunit
MGKKIRHLEFYGYADQNAYIGLPNTDLSDIREVNREQDKEINAISGATKEKADLDTVKELSGKVDTFIDKQGKINMWLSGGILKNKTRIDKLERRDKEITNKINEIVDEITEEFNPIYDELGRLNDKTDDLERRLNKHIEDEDEFEDNIKDRVSNLENEIDKKIDKREAYHTFAKKCDVYTKAEVDNLIEHVDDGFATEQWVLDRGYITEIDADGKYASKARLNALEDRVGDIQTSLYNQYNELNSDLSQFKTATNTRINTLYGRMDTLEAKHDREIENLTNTTNAIQRQVNQNEEAIRQINEISLPNKVDKSEFNDLKAQVNIMGNDLNNKVDKTDYERDKARFGVQLDSLDNRKADKTELNAVSGAVDGVDAKIDQERLERIAADNALNDRINSTNDRIDNVREENIDRDERLSNLERDLLKEINDRVNGDNAIIGSPNDREEDSTIYGAKKYADKVASNALAEAKAYTDIKDSSVRDYIDETRADFERQISGKADKAYVNAIKEEIEIEVDDKINAEKNRAMGVEASLEGAIRQEILRASGKENTISTALTHTSNIVKALTDWDGDDRVDYTDEGNGIVDVMHREIHDMKIAIANISEGNKTSNPVEAAFGTYNITHTGFANSDKTIFSIGIGTSDIDRKNALEVRKNGDIYMWVNGQYVCINNLLGQLMA